MKSVSKILIITLLGLSVVGCELLSPSYWKRVDERMEKKEQNVIGILVEIFIVEILNKIY